MAVHKNQVKQLKKHTKALEDTLEYYKEQQYLYKLMLGDLENYKEAFEKARDVGTFYSPFT